MQTAPSSRMQRATRKILGVICERKQDVQKEWKLYTENDHWPLYLFIYSYWQFHGANWVPWREV